MKNILLGCNHLHELGGSEQHLYTLAKGLKKRGFDVYVLLGNFTLKGKMSNLLEKDLSIKVDDIPKNTHFDAVFLSHTSTINRFVQEYFYCKDYAFNENNLFQICHGIFSDLEKPSSWHKLKYIAISEEVRNYILTVFKERKVVYTIFNPIDTDKFFDTESNLIIKNVFSLSQDEEFNKLLEQICLEKNYTFKKNNKHINPIEDIRENLESADVVFSLGRGCLEAMSMAKNVIIADNRGYMQNSFMDGLVTADNFVKFMHNNCSGRFSKTQVTKLNIINELNKYSLKNCYLNRITVKAYCDMNKIVNDYISVIKP